MPLRACLEASCPLLIRKGRRCPAHTRTRQRQYERSRGTVTQRGYGASWQKIRAQVLAEQPTCLGWPKGPCPWVLPAQHVDHILPRRRGGTEARSNLVGLCARCHSRKTATEDGGFGNHHETIYERL